MWGMETMQSFSFPRRKNERVMEKIKESGVGIREEAEKAYKEIFELMEKNKDLCSFDIESLKDKSENHLFGLHLKEDWGLDIDPANIYNRDWIKFGDHKIIGRWGEKHGRTISWPDGTEQPYDEVLLVISFPAGAYIFGDDYPQDLFRKLWDELRSFGPKYTDSHNHSLYFSKDNASGVFNSFSDIIGKYREINKVDRKKREIERLKKELENLENSK